MAIGKKTGGRDFKKGQRANPNGRPPVPYEIRELRKHNRQEIETTLSKYLRMTPPELKKVAENPHAAALDLMVVSVIMRAVQGGDQWRLNFLLERVVGKVKDPEDPTGDKVELAQSFIDLIRSANEKSGGTDGSAIE